MSAAKNAERLFRTIYPESDIVIAEITPQFDEYCLIKTVFPDGEFYFVVGESSISSGLRTKEAAGLYLNNLKK